MMTNNSNLVRLLLLLAALVALPACANIADDEDNATATAQARTQAAPTNNAPAGTAVAIDSAFHDERVAQGVAVYLKYWCGSCHTLDAANARGTFGPVHNDARLDAEDYITLHTYNGAATDAASYLRESIVNPAVFYTPGYEATNHHMPAFTNITADELDALVYMLMQQTERAYTLDLGTASGMGE